MATLTIWRFGSPDEAQHAARRVQSLSRNQLIVIHDAAVVWWPPDRKRPKLRQLSDLKGRGALSGAFWGMLSDVGIDDDLIQRIREQLTPGTSALFLLTSGAVIEKIQDVFTGEERPDLLFTNLSPDHEEALREFFAEEPTSPLTPS
jgi:uncharacterized membrane protein